MSIYDFEAIDIEGNTRKLSEFEGKVLLIVNTASKCGFTPQFEGLEALHQQYKDQGLVILGFPCNQFRSQDPGSEEEIATFCVKNYGVSFSMFSKIDVNGPEAHPLFTFLKQEAKGVLGTEGVKWNFTKFLVDRSGQVVDRFAPTAKPSSLNAPIEKLLKS